MALGNGAGTEVAVPLVGIGVGNGCLGNEVRKTHILGYFVLKTNTLPRQARDKHRENTQKRCVFRRSVVPDQPEACQSIAMRCEFSSPQAFGTALAIVPGR